MKKTKKAYEDYLNEIGSTVDDCIYMANKDRGGKVTTKASIERALNNNQYGKLLRIFDPIAFEVGYNDWKGNN